MIRKRGIIIVIMKNMPKNTRSYLNNSFSCNSLGKSMKEVYTKRILLMHPISYYQIKIIKKHNP